MNFKEENSDDFCPNYAQEFGLWRSGPDQVLFTDTVLACGRKVNPFRCLTKSNEDVTLKIED